MRDASHPGPAPINRRALLRGAAAASGALLLPAWARGADLRRPVAHAAGGAIAPGFDEVRGPHAALTIAAGPYRVAGRTAHAVAVNGTVPGPLVRLREGEEAHLTVHNELDEDSSIHWHGLLVPFQMDGVPGVSFPGIRPGERFTYRVPDHPVRHLLVSQPFRSAGADGPLRPDRHRSRRRGSGRLRPRACDCCRDSQPLHPHAIFGPAQGQGGLFQRAAADAGRTVSRPRPAAATGACGHGCGWTRPTSPTSPAPTYTFLVNGHGPAEGAEFLFRAGERVRLRFVNASAMTIFNVRIPGLPMTVVAADGQDVRPVVTDEFQIGVAETYDVIVEPG